MKNQVEEIRSAKGLYGINGKVLTREELDAAFRFVEHEHRKADLEKFIQDEYNVSFSELPSELSEKMLLYYEIAVANGDDKYEAMSVLTGRYLDDYLDEIER